MKDVLDTLNDRGKTHGDFESNAQASQSIKRLFRELAKINGMTLSMVQKEALDAFAVKLARILTGDPCFTDSWHDIAGYATLVCKDLTKTELNK